MSSYDDVSAKDFKQIIGETLKAVAKAQAEMAQTTIDFLPKEEAEKVEGPFISIVPIPNLQIDDVDISFDIENSSSKADEDKSENDDT